MNAYRRRPTETWEELAAAAAGILAGAAVFYVARLWIQREALPEGRPRTGRGRVADRGRRPPGGADDSEHGRRDGDVEGR